MAGDPAASLPNKPRGVPRVDDRRVLNGIFWVLRSRRILVRSAGALRPAHDDLQPLQPMEEGWRLGSSDGRDHRTARRRRADDRYIDCPRPSARSDR